MLRPRPTFAHTTRASPTSAPRTPTSQPSTHRDTRQPQKCAYVHTFPTHYRKPPLTGESHVTCAAMSRRKVVRAVMQRRFASPNEAGACSITPTSPRAPQHTHTTHPYVHTFPTRLRAGSRPPPESGFGRFPPWDNYKSQNPATILPCTDSSPARRRIPPQEGTDTTTKCHETKNATCKTTKPSTHNRTHNTHKQRAQNARTGMRTRWCASHAQIERYNPQHEALHLAQTTGKWPTKLTRTKA